MFMTNKCACQYVKFALLEKWLYFKLASKNTIANLVPYTKCTMKKYNVSDLSLLLTNQLAITLLHSSL